MKYYKTKLLEALFMLRDALKDYDIELAHNILIGGGTDQTEEEMESDVEKYLKELKELINITREKEN
jgi:AAA15 family ATPase/GTPase